MFHLYIRLTDFSVPICALRALPSTKGESLERFCSGSATSIINHLGKLSGESWSVSESSDPGHDLFVCRLVDGVLLVLILMIIREFSTVLPHTRHGVPTRGKRAQVPGTLPWWVRDCDSKVTGKMSVGHAELRSSIATSPPGPANLRRDVRPAPVPDKNFRRSRLGTGGYQCPPILAQV